MLLLDVGKREAENQLAIPADISRAVDGQGMLEVCGQPVRQTIQMINLSLLRIKYVRLHVHGRTK